MRVLGDPVRQAVPGPGRRRAHLVLRHAQHRAGTDQGDAQPDDVRKEAERLEAARARAPLAHAARDERLSAVARDPVRWPVRRGAVPVRRRAAQHVPFLAGEADEPGSDPLQGRGGSSDGGGGRGV